MAPGLQGANRTGRPFVGDHAGRILFGALLKLGYASGAYDADGPGTLKLHDCLITNAVRCLPPANRPTPAEIARCRPFLTATIARAVRLRAILALGRVAHDSTIRALGCRPTDHPFAHGAHHAIREDLLVFDCFHCSRYNINTGRLSIPMLEAVLADIRAHLASS